ncbi:MAG: GNAT family N-acetyltransferase [Anaerolineales bacterium]|nr:GNAT family N-acetyltransferase [Anaerolineales bacterium]
MPELTRYPDAQTFLSAAGDALYQNEPLHSLMIGVVERLTGDPHFYGDQDPYLAVITKDGVPMLAGTMTPPFGLVLSALREDAGGYISTLVSDLIASDWDLLEVNGESRYAKLFASEWAGQTGGMPEKVVEMRLYVLHQVTHPQDVPGKISLATMADHGVISEWLYSFEREALDGDRSKEHFNKAAEAQIGRREVYLWWDGGNPVSMCLRTRPTKTGISVSGVYTPPNLRRRGYASACVAALSQLLLDEGYAFASLFTDLANPTSNSIYIKIGYQPLADFDRYRLAARD